MADLAQLITPGPSPSAAGHAGPVLLDVLEAAQRLVAYCDNDPVGGTEDGELAGFGLPTMKLDRALRDLRRAVQAMNRTMASEDGCAILENLAPAMPRRFA
jgi:hypothetical protein